MRYKAIVKYVGSDYYGWQKQTKEVTVQATIEERLSRILFAFANHSNHYQHI